MPPSTVLILGGELGFMLALSQELTKRSISAYPARTAREARLMISRFQLNPDVLVINCGSPDACSFAEGLAKEHLDVEIIGIASERYQCLECADRLAATLHSSDEEAPERIPHCANVVQRLLSKQLAP